jgi:hypothetical protein
MCNCDKPTGRQYQWRAANEPVDVKPEGSPALAAVPLAFTTHASIVVRGPATGKAYRFDASRSTDVQLADATLMLSTGRFRKAS